jgi:hypothetical protein
MGGRIGSFAGQFRQVRRPVTALERPQCEWYVAKNIGTGLGADINTIKVKEYERDGRIFSASYTFAGPRIFVAASF